MSGLVDAIFGGGKPEPQGPSEAELAEQRRLEALEDKKSAIEKAKAVNRTKISTARAAGPQTLFTRPGSIPLPVKLSGAR